jgi:antitoxin component YwqK of YwqJK toxin-antitoxin module
MDGYGKLYYPNGKLAYEGEWKEDEFHGEGIVYNDNPTNLTEPFDYTDFNKIDE